MLFSAQASGAELNPKTRDTARSLANQAANAYARAEYSMSHSLCQKAYAIVPAPTIALLDARSLRWLGRFVEAVEAYERVVRAKLRQDAPEAFRRARVEAEIELAALRPRLPRLKVILDSVEPGLAISTLLDGDPFPDALYGHWLPTDPRPHTVVLQVENRPAVSRTVLLREGESRIVTVRSPSGTTAGPAQTWGFVGLGVAGTSLALGAITGIMALDARSDANRQCPDARCVRGSLGADSVNRFRTYRAISTIGYALGGVVAAAGTLVLLRAETRSEPELAISASIDGVRLTGSL